MNEQYGEALPQGGDFGLEKEWKHGICGCFDNLPWCCITCWFPCVTSYKVGVRLGLKNLAIASVVIFMCLYAANATGRVAYQRYETEAIENIQNGGSLGDKAGGVWVITMAVAYGVSFLLSVVVVVILVHMRSTLRRRYAVKGDTGTDVICSLFCGTCVLCQMHNHLEHERAMGAEDDLEPVVAI